MSTELVSRLELVLDEIHKLRDRREFHDDKSIIYPSFEDGGSSEGGFVLQFRSHNPFGSYSASDKLTAIGTAINAMVLEMTQFQIAQSEGEDIPLDILKNTQYSGLFLLDGLHTWFPEYFLLRGLMVRPNKVTASLKGILDLDQLEEILNTGSPEGVLFERSPHKRSEKFDIFHKDGFPLATVEGRGVIHFPYAQLATESKERYSLGVQHFAELVNAIHRDRPLIQSIPLMEMFRYLPIFSLLNPDAYLNEGELGKYARELVDNQEDLSRVEGMTKTKRGNYRFSGELPHLVYLIADPMEDKLVAKFTCGLDFEAIRDLASERGLSLSQQESNKFKVNRRYRKGTTIRKKSYVINSITQNVINEAGITICSINGDKTLVIPYGKLTDSQLDQGIGVLGTVYDRGLMFSYTAPIVDINTSKETLPGLTKSEMELIEPLHTLETFYKVLIKDALGKKLIMEGHKEGDLPSRHPLDWIYYHMKPDVEANPLQRILWVLESIDGELDSPYAKDIVRTSPEAHESFKQTLGAYQGAVRNL